MHHTDDTLDQAGDVAALATRVLLIDDEDLSGELIGYALQENEGIFFRHVVDASRALEAALADRVTVVLLDLVMPGIDGLSVIRRFRSCPETAGIPLVLLSSEDNPGIKARAFAEGANDYLVKWPDRRELVARVRYHSNAYLALRQRDEAFRSLDESRQELLKRTEELAQSQAALVQAQKMEVVGQLTGGVAHDFNNVLQVISGNLQMLKVMAADNDMMQRRIAAAIEGINRGSRLAAHLLAFARRQPLQPVVVSPALLLSGMGDLLRRSLGGRCELKIEVEAEAWNTLADPTQLENVILNLAINARDAVGGKGCITIRVANAPSAPASPFVGAKGDYVQLEVADNGCGMSPDVLERAFEPFFSTKPTGQGTGLGLSMAYGFVKQSGGYIYLDSEPGSGTRVRVYLPRAFGDAATINNTYVDAIRGGVETVLVVDDEPDIRESTAALLSSLGYHALEAEDGASALKLIENGARVDLLFTDVIMPGPVRCRELAERAQQLLPHLPVLFTSGYSEGELSQDGKLPDGISLLRKPYSADVLARTVRHMLRRAAAAAA